MAESANDGVQAAKKKDSASIGEVVDLVKEYAKQETLGPLKGAGRWLMLGSIGSVLLGLGLLTVLVAVLRLLQTEVSAFDGAFSWAPYGIVLVISLVWMGIALSRVRKSTLGKEPK